MEAIRYIPIGVRLSKFEGCTLHIEDVDVVDAQGTNLISHFLFVHKRDSVWRLEKKEYFNEKDLLTTTENYIYNEANGEFLQIHGK